MTRRERIAARIEKRRTWAISRERKSAAGFAKARTIADGIPLGQPILVGHHSEKRHRRDIERIDSGMRAGVESAKMAEHHTSTADNLEHALDRSIYSDDRDALETLRERIAEREAARDRIVALNKAIRKEYKAGLPDGWLERIGATEPERKAILSNVQHDYRHTPMFPPYVLSNLGGNITRDRERLKHIAAQQARTAAAEASPNGVTIIRSGTWCSVTFAEKPDRAILEALKAAGYGWGAGSWSGYLDKLPPDVAALAPAEPEPEPPPAADDDDPHSTSPDAIADHIAHLDETPDPLEAVTQGRTIWNSDGTEGPVLICAPPVDVVARDGCGCKDCNASRAEHEPADRTLPELAQVRDIENPDPAPVADVPAQTFELRPPAETLHTPIRLQFD